MMMWLRWMVVCRFGRRCAHLVLAEDIPPNVVVLATYTCEGCGRTYMHPLTRQRLGV